MKRKTRLILLTIIGTMIILLIALGFSYAYMKGFIGSPAQTKVGVNNCAKILLTDSGSSISLTNTYPMSDNAGLNTTPYTFGVRSTCSGNRGFKLYIVTLNGNTLNANNVKYALTPKGSKEIISMGIVGSLSTAASDFNATATTQLASSVGTVGTIYFAYEDNLALGEVTNYDLYMWVDKNVTNTTFNQTFSAAVAVLEGTYFEYDIAVKMASLNTYDANVSCSNSTDAQWNPLNRRVEIFDVSGVPANCNVTENANTNMGTLKSIVESANDVYEEEGFANYTNIAQGKYTIQTPFYTSSFSNSVTSGTDEAGAISWDSTNNYWVTNPAVASKHYYYLINVADAGYYQLCYKQLSGGTSNRLYRYKNTTNMYTSTYLTASSTTDVCLDYGYVNTTDTIRIDQYTYSAVASLAIYLKKPETVVSAGYRYEGEDPNNYVWFNNELWRIIGSIPTKIDSGGSTTTTNLVKIIRENPIGGLVWNITSSPRPDWNASTLYTLLNNYYYGAQNATGNTYCYGYSSNAKAKCDYRYIGINPSGYYGLMIKEVYWNTGESHPKLNPIYLYADEIARQTMTGHVGIMNVSDYGFASSYNRPSRTTMNTYNSANYTGNDWLYGKGYEWTLTSYFLPSTYAFSVKSDGFAGSNYVYYGVAARPVVYLDSSVYVVSGDGTQATPYKIAWPSGS